MLPKGTRIIKQNSQPGDAHQDGAPGVIVSGVEIPQFAIDEIRSVDSSMPDEYNPEVFYFVEWSDLPGIPVGVVDYRIKPINNGNS